MVRGPGQPAVSTDRRQCLAKSLRAPQAAALPKPSGVALEQSLHCQPRPDRRRSCSSSQALSRCPPHIDRSSSAPTAHLLFRREPCPCMPLHSHTSSSAKIRRCCVDSLNSLLFAPHLLRLRESKALFFSLLSLGPCFRLSPCFCLALLLCSDSGEPLLLRFRSLAFCFSIDCCLCLTLFCFFKPLLLRFLGLALCFGVGSRLGLVRAR